MRKEERNIYISNTDVEKAKSLYMEKLNIQPNVEEIDVLGSMDRVTYEAVYAQKSSPYYNAAAMDGIVVRAEWTYGATEVNPLILEEGKDFQYINTGNPIPNDYDAVIMIEDVIELGSGKVKIIKPAYPWQHIRLIGEDIVATEMIIPSKHKIRPIDLGALISGGIEKIKVYKKPLVGIIPTGTELVENVKELEKGKILESNSRVFEGLTFKYGGIPKRYSPVSDKYNLLKESILEGIEENDILIINAGSSAGTEDYTAKAIRELGQVVVHGVALKPGKPTILGIINNKPVIGVPGYPVSAYLTFDTFVKPLIYKYTGQKEDTDTIKATISKRIVSSLKHKELIRVTLGYVQNRYIATPLTRGAGVTMSLVKADGILEIPQNSEGIEAGEEVKVKLLKSKDKIKDTLVSIGSHDLIMDVIGDMMNLSSGHIGSMGGIMAMKRGECHIAPVHLLDPESGEYNIPYIKKYFPGKRIALVKGVRRLQGFIVQKGNPYRVKSFKDLIRENVAFVNRQRGSGTRMLLDYNLNKLGINSNEIRGYEREMTTHMAVAMAVKSGTATTGLGIMSAAKAMDLEFIPVGYEDYDFIVPYEFLEDKKIKEFVDILKSKEFKDKVSLLGGYEFKDTGEVKIIKSN
ncbi:molybdopterin biosynthesis protein [Thermohalobacter berrensis]|uniref:Molybdopterin molybdenumtransferase n=1 Tax=Thermohalobacter berrensis TaxID=99594 RepID=A0A419T2H0_9FIRM|nr:molybdopterin biosynthesis protein [Thermohalobacter berrensis]RKD31646.1 molybdopterin biosynthesis protein [Thermohalobacter berrensis]